jgi:hypothetical protein
VAVEDMARSHVERCLQDLWGTDQVVPDKDGDYPYGSGSAACYIRVDGREPVFVQAVAIAAVGVKKTAALLTEINEVNSRTRIARVFWESGAVVVEQSLMADTVDRQALGHAGLGVAAIANDIGPMIATVFGGATPLQQGQPGADDSA